MDPDASVLERAFELAKSGRYQTLQDVERQLGKEGYRSGQLEGPALRAQLRGLINAAHATIRTVLARGASRIA